MPVFISYKRTDSQHAQYINQRLMYAGIKTYLDVLDIESQTTEDITGVITKNIARCSHMIAVISHSTKESWWVPFEIGEATMAARRISSYVLNNAGTPEFLNHWPKMTTDQHLTYFIEAYRTDSGVAALTLDGVSDYFERSVSKSRREQGAAQFHTNLKERLRRGY